MDETKKETVNIVIADNNVYYKKGLYEYLRKSSYFKDITLNEFPERILEELSGNSYHAVLINWSLLSPGIFNLAQRIRSVYPDVMLIAYHDKLNLRVMYCLDKKVIDGFFLQNEKRSVIEKTIQQTLIGEFFLSSQMVNFFIGLQLPYDVLTPKEMDVYHLLLAGCQAKEIASNENFSIATFYGHREKILKKINVRNDVELLTLALSRNWIALDEVMKIAANQRKKRPLSGLVFKATG